MLRPRRGLPPALLLTAVIGLAGCGSEPSGPTVLSSPPASPSTATASSRTTVTPPPLEQRAVPATTKGSELPVDRQGKPTDEELLAAATGYYEAVERAYRTLDVSEIEQYVTSSCEGCRKQIEALELARREGYTIEGGQYEYSEQAVLSPVTSNTASVRLGLVSSGVVVRDSRGRVVHQSTRQNGPQQINLARKHGDWQVDEVLELVE